VVDAKPRRPQAERSVRKLAGPTPHSAVTAIKALRGRRTEQTHFRAGRAAPRREPITDMKQKGNFYERYLRKTSRKAVIRRFAKPISFFCAAPGPSGPPDGRFQRLEPKRHPMERRKDGWWTFKCPHPRAITNISPVERKKKRERKKKECKKYMKYREV